MTYRIAHKKTNQLGSIKASRQTSNTSAPVIEGDLTSFNHVYGENEPRTYWYHPDHASTMLSTCPGSSSYSINVKGIVTQHTCPEPCRRVEYMPYGESLVEEHQNSIKTPYKFNSKELDDESGNYYYGARYYNPKFSFWLSVDPLAEQMPSWSSYNFSFNNPVRYKDPDGRAPFDWVIQADNTVVYDSRVTDQASAETYYEGSTHILNGTNVTTVSGKEITLGAGGYWASGGQVTRAPDRAPSVYVNKLDGSDGVTVASAFTAAAKEVQYSKLFQSYRGINGKMYNGLNGRGPNQYTGSRGNAKAKAGRIGMGSTALGTFSVGMTMYDYQQSLDINYGPNMRRHLDQTYGMDQSFNVSGFLGVIGASASFGYNLGYLIEGACNCNIQYNPYTGDFTPIEQTYMQYDRLGMDLSKD